MGAIKNKGKKSSKVKFNRPGGMHNFKIKRNRQREEQNVMDRLKLIDRIPCTPYYVNKMCSDTKMNVKKVASKILKKYKVVKGNSESKIFLLAAEASYVGNRIINLDKLTCKILDVTTHVAFCNKLKENFLGGNVIKFISEKREGFYFILNLECLGCGKKFFIENCDNVNNSNIKELNLRCVWGSMVTGGGYSSLNELMGTAGIPSVSERKYSDIEHEIGNLWKQLLETEMNKAAYEERQLAIDNDEFFQGVPSVTVVCDGGWSKRTHKHTYNAMCGVGVIFGLRTKKLLHIGIRNKMCYTCNKAKNMNMQPKDHECFRNWDESSQSMESDIILEGFLNCETKYGIRYMSLIADGDSSVYANIISKVPVWGQYVRKLECSNHSCKCLRVNLEKLVNDKPHYKGRNKLTKINIQKITCGVRCAIKMRSEEGNRSSAIRKLKADIRNAGRHVLGFHDYCSTDFCNQKIDVTSDKSNSSFVENDEDNIIDDVIISQTNYWKTVTSDLSEKDLNIIRIGGNKPHKSEQFYEEMLKDIYIILNRMADKADRLIGNFTSNLAESWMSVRCKFDGGKMYNKAYKGSFYARCYGGALRTLLGPAWAPHVYSKITGLKPDAVFLNTYRMRSIKYRNSIKSSKRKSNILKRKQRKFKTVQTSKKARHDYGENVLEDSNDITEQDLICRCDIFIDELKNNLTSIEEITRGQSANPEWKIERKKRLTSSNFGEVMNRSIKNNSISIIKRYLYSNFKGTIHTIRGLSEEENARLEYISIMNKDVNIVKNITVPGLVVDKKYPFLAASSDGVVHCVDGNDGLIEIKTLLNNCKTMIKDFIDSKKTFCLKRNTSSEIILKPNHKYFYQIQGQLNILNYDWCDLIIRRVNPHDIYIIRVLKDSKMWENYMIPKLKDFYFTHLLPELAAPRYKTITGIRKPKTPWHEKVTQPTNLKTADSGLHSQHTTTELTKVTNIPSSPQPSCSSEQDNPVPRKRQRRIKFVGRRINHQWKLEDSSFKWFSGSVLCTSKGKDGDPKAIYQVLYDGEDEPYDVDDMISDYNDGSLKFYDI